MEKSSEKQQELQRISLPNLSLNPLASEFIPSYLKCTLKNTLNPDPYSNRNSQKMKSETTSTTTLVHREVVGDASYLHAQRQLLELLHQLGHTSMPVKSIDVSLTPDGHGINVQFMGEPGALNKEMLDENLRLNAALHLEIGDLSSMPQTLPNMLAASFMRLMADVLNNKIERNDQPENDTCSSAKTNSRSETKQDSQAKRLKLQQNNSPISKTHNVPGVNLKKQAELFNLSQNVVQSASLPSSSQVTKIPSPVGGLSTVKNSNSRSKLIQKSGSAKPDSQHDKKSIKVRPSPRKSLSVSMKKSTQKLAPRGTHTSLMRQIEAKKRLNLLNDENN